MNRRNSKKRNRKTSVSQESFSLGDAWEVLVVIMLLSLCVYAVHLIRSNPYYTYTWPEIKYVDVSGSTALTNGAKLKNLVTQNIQGGFFRIPIEELEQQIQELPWVHTVSVKRYWPSTLKIKIKEQDAIARWGKFGMMNVYGEVFFPTNNNSYEYLPMLFGETSRSKKLAKVFEKSLNVLKPYGLQLRALIEDERQSKHLVLSNGLILAIGDGNAMKKIDRFITAYQQYLHPQLSEVKKIDLRYTNGLAIEWKDSQLASNLKLGGKL